MTFRSGQQVRPKDDRHQWCSSDVTLTILAVIPSRVATNGSSLRLRVQWRGRESFEVWQPAADFEPIES